MWSLTSGTAKPRRGVRASYHCCDNTEFVRYLLHLGVRDCKFTTPQGSSSNALDIARLKGRHDIAQLQVGALEDDEPGGTVF